MLVDSQYVSYPGSWSFGDQRFAYSVQSPDTGSDIWVLSEGEDTPISVFQASQYQEFHPFFSPDGRWLVYVSDASGRPEVYVQPYPATGSKWQISASGGAAPIWTPSGEEILYWSADTLMSVEVSTTPRFTPSKERVFMETPFTDILSWDIAPDGEKFLVVGRIRSEDVGSPFRSGRRTKPAAGVAELRVVVDWFEELNAVK